MSKTLSMQMQVGKNSPSVSTMDLDEKTEVEILQDFFTEFWRAKSDHPEADVKAMLIADRGMPDQKVIDKWPSKRTSSIFDEGRVCYVE